MAANRDEQLSRPASAMAVLHGKEPRILGGKDALAGGTWLAVNEHGVFAGLTNRPAAAGRDPMKRSRGELPLALALHDSAASAVEAFQRRFHPKDFNPAWLFAGDARSLYYLDFTGGDDAVVAELRPGLHILENRPLGEPSAKVERVRELLSGAERRGGPELIAFLRAVLGDHTVPALSLCEAALFGYPPQAQAACVHAGPYGTRSSEIVLSPSGSRRPKIYYTAGPSCVNEFNDADAYWFA